LFKKRNSYESTIINRSTIRQAMLRSSFGWQAHDLDWLRLIAIIILLFFHTGMWLTRGVHVKNNETTTSFHIGWFGRIISVCHCCFSSPALAPLWHWENEHQHNSGVSVFEDYSFAGVWHVGDRTSADLL